MEIIWNVYCFEQTMPSNIRAGRMASWMQFVLEVRPIILSMVLHFAAFVCDAFHFLNWEASSRQGCGVPHQSKASKESPSLQTALPF